MSTLKNIEISTIAANPYRNFSIYPMDKSQVTSLASSFDEVGDFGVLPVRRAAYHHDDGSEYELAAGHHRLAAMREMGVTHVDVKVEDYDDDDMVKVMALENAKQKGDNMPALLDSMSGICQRVAYILLVSDSADDLAQICATWELSQKQFDTSKGLLMAGKGIGHDLVAKYAPNTFTGQRAIAILLTTLSDTGQMTKILDAVTADVNAEREAELEIEAAREEAAEKARRKAAVEEKAAAKMLAEANARAKEAEAARVIANKLADKAAKQKAKVDALRIERERKEAEANARAMAKLRERAAAVEAKRREEADAKAAARKAQMEQAAAASAAFKEKARGVHPDVIAMLPKSSHLEAFRAYVAGKPEAFPTAKQPALVERIKKLAAELEEPITAAMIQDVLHTEYTKVNAFFLGVEKDKISQRERKEYSFAVDNAVKDFVRSIRTLRSTGDRMSSIMEDPRKEERAFRELGNNVELRVAIGEGLKIFTRLEEQFGAIDFSSPTQSKDNTVISTQ